MPTNTGHFKRLERLHSHFSLIDSTGSSMFNVTLAEHRRFHIAIQMYKILTKVSLSYLHTTFKSAMSVKNRTGCSSHRLYIPAIHINYGK